MINPDLSDIELSLSEYKRYSRHLLLPQVQIEGQKRLAKSRILCVGAGGLGSSNLLYLAASGIGHITILDDDFVDISNLQRQVIHNTSYLNFPKVESAENYLLKLNPNCTIETQQTQLNGYNIAELIASHDLVIDGSDNLTTRYLIDEYCYLLSKPWIYGAIFQFEGQVSTFNYKGGPRYQDLYPRQSVVGNELSCSEGGVLGVLPGIIGAIQATECLKVILGIGDCLSGYLLLVNTLTFEFKKVCIRHDLSAQFNFIHHNLERERKSDKSIISVHNEINLEALLPLIQTDSVTLLDIRSATEFLIDNIPGSINHPLHSLYDKTNLQHLLNTSGSRNIIVYCNLNSRSKIAMRLLQEAHIPCQRLKNGIYAWKHNQSKFAYNRSSKNNSSTGNRRERDSNPC